MGALGTYRVPKGQKGRQGQSPSRPSYRGNSGAGEKGQKGHTPFRGVPNVPEPPSASPTASFGYAFVSDAEAADFEERAAIREFVGGLTRAAAERLAWLDVLSARASSAQPLAKAG